MNPPYPRRNGAFSLCSLDRVGSKDQGDFGASTGLQAGPAIYKEEPDAYPRASLNFVLQRFQPPMTYDISFDLTIILLESLVLLPRTP